jgi:hypothetical protein
MADTMMLGMLRIGDQEPLNRRSGDQEIRRFVGLPKESLLIFWSPVVDRDRAADYSLSQRLNLLIW